MTRFSKAVCAAVVLLFSMSAHAQVSKTVDWYCKESSGLKYAHLQCVSCGIQEFYRDRGLGEVYPSEKWLALLALSHNFPAGEPAKKPTRRDSIVVNFGERAGDFQTVISKIQAYGFCTDDAKMPWSEGYYTAINRPYQIGDLDDLLLKTGFKKPATKNFQNFFDDSELKYESLNDRRRAFNEKLYDAVKNEKYINTKDSGQEIRSCLINLDARNKKILRTDAGSLDLCKIMAKKCEIEDSFCYTKGMNVPGGGGMRPVPGQGNPGNGGSRPSPPAPVPRSAPVVR